MFIRFVAFCFIITVIIFPSASVSTRTTKLGAGHPSIKETAIATMRTTTKGVPTMAATAVPKLCKEEPWRNNIVNRSVVKGVDAVCDSQLRHVEYCTCSPSISSWPSHTQWCFSDISSVNVSIRTTRTNDYQHQITMCNPVKNMNTSEL